MKHDPIEETVEYQEAMKIVQPILDKAFPPEERVFGFCHKLWAMKKVLLREQGIEWKSPKELNPHIIYD